MDLARYLRRIGFEAEPRADLTTLRTLHHAHLLHVPFENLDIRCGRPIVLDEQSFYRKVVDEHRGGFCYELNGLFAWALREIGFAVTLLSANVYRPDGGIGGDFGHVTLRVDLDRPWLADVGFGDAFREPLALEEIGPQSQIDRDYRLVDEGTFRVLYARIGGGEWLPRYRFGLVPYPLSAFAAGCAFHQTSPDSPFTRNRVCTLALPNGRITVWNSRLIETGLDGRKTERELGDWQEVSRLLRERFAIEADQPIL